MAEVELNGHRFLIGTMSVFDAAHVARKVAPVVSTGIRGYAHALQQLAAATTNGHDTTAEVFFDAIGPVTEILAAMPEDDVNYVIKKCLGVCSIHNGQRWAAMINNGQLMFEQETDLGTMLQLVMEVVKDNLGPTLRGLLPLFSGGEASTSPSSLPQ
jgi:hypothetical protein